MGGVTPAATRATFDDASLERSVSFLLRQNQVDRPPGIAKPRRSSTSTTGSWERCPQVKAWVLQTAKGQCECCGQTGPFITESGFAYLEVHHVRPLADGGPDTIENAAGVCPNCHRWAHSTLHSDHVRDLLYSRVDRLVQPDS